MLVDEFIAKFKEKYGMVGIGKTSFNRLMTNISLIDLYKISQDMDIYTCSWHNMCTSYYDFHHILNELYRKFYSDIPINSMIDDQSLNILIELIKDTMGNDDSLWNHGKVAPDDIPRVFIQTAKNTKFEFSDWIRGGAATNLLYQPLGLIADKFLTMEFMNRHASNVGVILNWDASFMDIDCSKYKLMVIDRWDVIIDRLIKKFGGDNKKLPRFCYGFNDFYLLRPITVTILRDKKVPDEIYKWFCLWHFRRMWGSTPSDELFAKAICKSWDRFRETLRQEGYQRNHMFNCLMRMLQQLKTVPLTKDQIGDLYPVLVKAAIKKNDKTAATFLQGL